MRYQLTVINYQLVIHIKTYSLPTSQECRDVALLRLQKSCELKTIDSKLLTVYCSLLTVR